MEVLFQAVVYALTLSALYLPIALGINLVFGVMRILNFAHGELYMLGGLFTWWFLNNTPIGFFPSLVLSVLVLAAIGVLIEQVLLRPMGSDILPALIVSIGVSLVLQTGTLIIAGSDLKRYSFPLQGTVSFGGANVSAERLMITLLGFLGVAVFYLMLQRTSLGRVPRAVAQDRRAATLQGINPTLITVATMAIGTGLAAMAGGPARPGAGRYPMSRWITLGLFVVLALVPVLVQADPYWLSSLSKLFINAIIAVSIWPLFIIGRLTLAHGAFFGLGAYRRNDRDSIAADVERVFSLFPRLRERRRQMAETLSGGEQQMVAIARALMSSVRLLLLDEPSLGLAPVVVRAITDAIKEIHQRQGIAVVLVEQNARMALSLANRAYVIETGRIVADGRAADVAASELVRKAYLGL